MSDESPLIILGKEPETWGVIAHRNGMFKPLVPKFFQPMGSYQEVIETVRIRIRIDPRFADFVRRHAGWHIAGVRVDNQVDL